MCAPSTAAASERVYRVHLGCGARIAPGWINCDVEHVLGADLQCNILRGLPFERGSIDIINAQHVLQDIRIWDQLTAVSEIARVMKSDGVLRLSLPDLDKAIHNYQIGNSEYFSYNWDTISGNFITHILWHNYTKTLFTCDFAVEILRKSGFANIQRAEFGKTFSRFPDIVDLDNRPEESFYVEATLK